MARTLTPELMDSPDAPREELEGALRFIRFINRRLGGARALVSCLDRWSRRWPSGRAITLLDVATGSADIPVAARAWALRRGHDLRVTAVDVHETTLDLAREHVARQPREVREGVEIVRADALRLVDVFAPGAFDYAHAGMFLHHLNDIQTLTVLAIMDRLAARGLVWNDLSRSALARLGVRALTLGAPAMVKHDARASVEAGFTRREAEGAARRVGLTYCRYRPMFFSQRFVVAGEKPGAWA
jgi:SAM-dependent methyltransferase